MDPMNPDDGSVDPNQGMENFDPPNQEGFAEDPGFQDPPPTGMSHSQSSSSAPWAVAVVALLCFLGSLYYFHHKVSDAETRASSLEAENQQLKHDQGRLQDTQRQAVEQAKELTTRADEANTKLAKVSQDFKDKDAELTRLETKLRAAVKANPKGKLAKLVTAALSKAEGEPAPAAGGPAAKAKHGKHH